MSQPLSPTQPSPVLGKGTRLVLTPGVLSSVVGGDTVILDSEHGRYYGMDAVATFIFARIQAGQDLADIHLGLTETFDAAPDELWRDLEEFARELIQKNICMISPHPRPPQR